MLIHGISLWEAMKRALLALAFLLCIISYANAKDVHVRGYTRKDGRYVQPHYRSAPDGNPYNNWSTKGNVNPYTGKPGTKDVVPGYQGQRPDYPLNVSVPPSQNNQPASSIEQEYLSQKNIIGSNMQSDTVLAENQMINMKLPYCKSFSAIHFVGNSSGAIKRCECNGKVLLTNLFCQCQPCMNQGYAE